MVNIILVQFLVLLFTVQLMAKVDRVHLETYLGEKRLDSYSERYEPLIFQDIYQGKTTFQDDIFFQNFFNPYLFTEEKDYAFFLKSELNGGLLCSNELLSQHFDDIRYSYRLIALSYLIEGEWHLKMVSDHLKLKNGCAFDLKKWSETCHPKSTDMKKFIARLKKYNPKYHENLSIDYKKDSWWADLKKHDFTTYSHYRISSECRKNCSEEHLAKDFQRICQDDQDLMTLICSEMDDIYGLSQNRDAYFLLGQSNIINTYNKQGEAIGCLRRFSEIMAHKEVRYDVLNQLFPALQNFLKDKYKERFLQGRVFFYGASKEFEEKGLSDIYVVDQPLQIAKVSKKVEQKKTTQKPVQVSIAKSESKIAKAEPVSEKTEKKEIKAPVKSAFLQATELLQSGKLKQVEVDMLKLKYDYVFSLNQMNSLSKLLKIFMTREALVEMMNYDKLGTKEGPVPLLFIKFMIDMQEHHGLWNTISVLGDRFYVGNDLDTDYETQPQMVLLKNDESTGNQWQLYVVEP